MALPQLRLKHLPGPPCDQWPWVSQIWQIDSLYPPTHYQPPAYSFGRSIAPHPSFHLPKGEKHSFQLDKFHFMNLKSLIHLRLRGSRFSNTKGAYFWFFLSQKLPQPCSLTSWRGWFLDFKRGCSSLVRRRPVRGGRGFESRLSAILILPLCPIIFDKAV